MDTLEEHYARDPIPTWFFVLVVVRDGDRFLLVQENKPDRPWYIPAGRVEPGESLIEAAAREALEETGLPVEIERVIRIDHTPFPENVARVRVYLVARPAADHPPKSNPDRHSLQAAWFRLDEIRELPLRGEEAYLLCEYVAMDAPLYSLDVLGVDDIT
jgi:ADP-ribose pyrophosphatase YjhB (NUDIX family)